MNEDPENTKAPASSTAVGQIAANLFRRESARLVAMLAGQFGTHRLQLAEDVAQEALVRAELCHETIRRAVPTIT